MDHGDRRDRLKRELAVPARGPSAFQRLAPGAFWRDEPLPRIEALLDEPDVTADLDALEETRAYPRALLDRLHAARLPALFAEDPAAAGGSPRATVLHGAALSALSARRSGSLAVALGVNYLGLLPAYAAASPELLRRIGDEVRDGVFAALLLTELDHGSNLSRTSVRATRAGDDAPYVLDGDKDLINGGTQHRLLTVLARTAGAAGTPGELSLFVVFRGDDTVALPRWRTLPVHGADIGGVSFRGARVPASQRLGNEGQGFEIVQRTLAATRGGVSAFASGAAGGALDLARAYAGRRDVYGAPIHALGAIADHLVRMEALDLVIAATCLKALLQINALGDAAQLAAAVAKLTCCALAEEVVTEGRRVLGSRALLGEGAYERFIRDVLVYGAFDGSSHLMLDQLHWRLAQVAMGTATAGSDDLAEAARVYSTPPRPLVEVCRLRGRVFLPSLRGRVRALAAVASPIDLAPLEALAGALADLTNGLRDSGRWDAEQGVRFDAAETFALFEAILALVELADPDRRGALGMPAVLDPEGRHDASYRAALGGLGARVASRLRALSLRGGLTPDAALGGAEAALWTISEQGRRALLRRYAEG